MARSSTSQASSPDLQADNSAARCRVFQGWKKKLRKKKKLTKAQLQSAYSQASNSVNFKYSAMNPAVSVSTADTSTDRPTVLAKLMARPRGSNLLPPARPRKARTSQASHSKSQTENSAARCRIFQEQEPKLLKNKQLTKAQSQPENIQAGDSVNFQYSAMNPEVSVTSPATSTGRPTLMAKWVCRRNIAVVGSGKKGSYLYYLDRKIKFLKSKIASYVHNLARELTLVCCKIDLYSQELLREVKLLNSKIDSHAHDLKKRIMLLHSKIGSYAGELDGEIQLLNSKIDSYTQYSGKYIERLNSKIAPYAHDAGRDIIKLNSKTAEYTEVLDSNINFLNCKLDSYNQELEREAKLLKSKMYNYVKLDSIPRR